MNYITATERHNALVDILQRIEANRATLEANGLGELVETANRYHELKGEPLTAHAIIELSYNLEELDLVGASLDKAETEIRELAFWDIKTLLETDLNSGLEIVGRWS